METIAHRLGRLRKAKRLSIVEAARRIGVAATTYRDWEYGNAIRGEPYLKICEVFGVGIHELLGQDPGERTQIRRKLSEVRALLEEVDRMMAAHE